MVMSTKRASLQRAKSLKNDEFYTTYEAVSAELPHYSEALKGKRVLCPCDNPKYSRIYLYLKEHFKDFGLLKLGACSISSDRLVEYDGTRQKVVWLDGCADFFSEECKAIRQKYDLVVTNPPFSVIRRFLTTLFDEGKQFIVIANQNCLHAEKVLPFVQSGQLVVGHTHPTRFTGVLGEDLKLGNARWLTNTGCGKVSEPLELKEFYSPEKYPMFDNLDVISVDRLQDMPCDYEGLMGVPTTILEKYCPEQVELLGLERWFLKDGKCNCVLAGKSKYERIIIRLSEKYLNEVRNLKNLL